MATIRNKHEKYPKHIAFEVVVITLLFVVVNVVSAEFQPSLTYNQGQGWDGTQYYAVAQDVANGAPIVANSPFVYRFGVPFLVGTFSPNNLDQGFFLINLFSNVILIVLFWVWLRRWFSNPLIRILLCALLITLWLSPIRRNYLAPVHVTSLFLVLLIAGLILVDIVRKDNRLSYILWLSVVTFFGVFVREVMLLVPIALLFVSNPIALKTKHRKVHILSPSANVRLVELIPLTFGIIALVLTRFIVTPNNTYSFIGSVLYYSYHKALITYLLAWFLTFGPLLIVLIFDWKNAFKFLNAHQHLFFVFVAVGTLGWIGGSVTERFLFWSMPITYVLIGRALHYHSRLLTVPIAAIITITQLISHRVFWTTPDYPNPFEARTPLLTQPSSNIPHTELYSFSATPENAVILFIQYGLLTVVILWYLYAKALQSGQLNQSSSGLTDHTPVR